MRTPDFLVVGAQKSGTTSLLHYLGGHPAICTAPREVHYFDRNHDKGIDWYGAHFGGCGTESQVGESTPEYLYLDDVPARIASALPLVRLIAVLREPVARAYSHYWHNRTRGHEPLSFADAIEAEPERLDGADQWTRCRFSYVDRGMYDRQLERLAAHFLPETVAVVLFDDLVERPIEMVQGLYSFLGTDAGVVPPTIEEARNPFMVFRSMRLRAPIRRLPTPLRKAATKLNMRYARYEPPGPAVVERLHDRFAGPNRRLASRLGRDLSGWSRPEQT